LPQQKCPNFEPFHGVASCGKQGAWTSTRSLLGAAQTRGSPPRCGDGYAARRYFVVVHRGVWNGRAWVGLPEGETINAWAVPQE